MNGSSILEGIVSKDPDIVSGALVFAGTRVPVKILVDYLLGGETVDDFLEGFPGVYRAQVITFLDATVSLASEKLS